MTRKWQAMSCMGLTILSLLNTANAGEHGSSGPKKGVPVILTVPSRQA